MKVENENSIKLVLADKKIRDEWKKQSNWPPGVVESHMHLENGFSIVAKNKDELIGMVSIYWREVADLIPGVFEGYIDIIEVKEEYRRLGIATMLIRELKKLTQEKDVYQIRAWSSEDKKVAIKMWRNLGFGICPAKIFPDGEEIKGVYALFKINN